MANVQAVTVTYALNWLNGKNTGWTNPAQSMVYGGTAYYDSATIRRIAANRSPCRIAVITERSSSDRLFSNMAATGSSVSPSKKSVLTSNRRAIRVTTAPEGSVFPDS